MNPAITPSLRSLSMRAVAVAREMPRLRGELGDWQARIRPQEGNQLLIGVINGHLPAHLVE